ncbi:MAG: hypothetical protein GY714_30770, partial [Desulfobacterales bacterium]|nr:hypothetical protein [Desulfobacterales bacterium]
MHKTVSKSCHVCFNRVKRAARRIYFTLPSHFRRKLGWTFLSKNTWKNPLFSFFRCAGASFSFNCACEKSVSLFHFNCPSRGSVRSNNLFSGFSSFSKVCNPGKVLPFGDARFSGSELATSLLRFHKKTFSPLFLPLKEQEKNNKIINLEKKKDIILRDFKIPKSVFKFAKNRLPFVSCGKPPPSLSPLDLKWTK